MDLRDLSKDMLESVLREMGEQPYRAAQIMRWLYKANAEAFDQMTNLSAGLRQKLAERFTLNPFPACTLFNSADGTQKGALQLQDGSVVEFVLIPADDRLTLCVSSQVGCKFGCKFCRTATLGFGRHLDTSEILLQVLVAQKLAALRDRRITNIVFMGMGEPLDNYDNVVSAIQTLLLPDAFDYSKRKITLSSVGHVAGLKKLGTSGLGINLAISLHAANDALRNQMMPVNKTWPVSELIDALRHYPLDRRQRITIEYIVIKNLNARESDAKALTKLLHGIPVKINLIPFNPFCGCSYERPEDKEVLEFREMLSKRGFHTSVRLSRGSDSLAACGQLGQRTK